MESSINSRNAPTSKGSPKPNVNHYFYNWLIRFVQEQDLMTETQLLESMPGWNRVL